METAPRMPLKRAAALEIQSAKGMVHMGGRASVRVSLWLFPLFPFCRTTPPSNQVEPGKTLPSVKLKNPNLPGFGTVPLTNEVPVRDREITFPGIAGIDEERIITSGRTVPEVVDEILSRSGALSPADLESGGWESPT